MTKWLALVVLTPCCLVIASGAERATLRTGHPISAIAFSPDGKTLASGDIEGGVTLWDVGTGTKRRSLVGHTDSADSVVFASGGELLAAAGRDGTIRLWRSQSGKTHATFKADAHCLAVSPDGKTLLAGALGGQISMWDVVAKKQLPCGIQNGDFLSDIVFLPDGKTVAVNGRFIVRLWDMNTFKLKSRIFEDCGCLVFTKDSKSYVTGHGRWGFVKRWDTATGKMLAVFKGEHDGRVACIALSPDGKTVASGSNDLTLKLWDMGTGRELVTLSGHSNTVSSVVFSPDGKTLASASHEIKLWDVSSVLSKAKCK